jgi:hypothetical protein
VDRALHGRAVRRDVGLSPDRLLLGVAFCFQNPARTAAAFHCVLCCGPELDWLFDHDDVESDMNNEFEIGDVVSRDSSDLHLVTNSSGDMISVVCIREPTHKWATIGETEDNTSWRYHLVISRAEIAAAIKFLLAQEE